MDSLVGSGTATATATFFIFPVTMTSPAQAYLLEPQDAGEVARLGLEISSLAGTIRAEAPIRLRTTPDIGADIAFSGLPNSVLGLPISIEALNLTLAGRATGGSFTRNPTACVPATTELRLTSYGAPSSAVAAQSTFTPTGCEALAYAPSVSGAGVVGEGDDLALTVGAVQPGGQAAHKRVQLTLPDGIFGRVSTLLDACSAPDAATCPASATVGSATVTTPLLVNALVGRLVLARRATGLPGLTAVFPAPFPLRLEGTTSLAGTRFAETFDGIPDVPISGLEVRFDGGSRSLFEPFPALCDGGTVLDGEFTGHNGSVSHAASPVSLSGCRPRPARAGGALDATGVTEAVGAVKATARLTLSGLGGRAPRVGLTVKVPREATGLKVVDVRLPRGLRVGPTAPAAGVRGLFDGHPKAGTTAGRSRSIRATTHIGAGAHAVVVILKRPRLRVDPALARRIRARRRVVLTVHAAVKDAAGRTSTLAVRARAR